MGERSGYVLLVEDDADIAEVVEMVLRAADFEVVVARDGREALEAIGRCMPRLIVLDMLMPVMDGWHFATEFQRRYGRAAPIVVLTAAEHARQRALAIGAVDVVAKPFDVDALCDVVKRFAGPSQLRPGGA